MGTAQPSGLPAHRQQSPLACWSIPKLLLAVVLLLLAPTVHAASSYAATCNAPLAAYNNVPFSVNQLRPQFNTTGSGATHALMNYFSNGGYSADAVGKTAAPSGYAADVLNLQLCGTLGNIVAIGGATPYAITNVPWNQQFTVSLWLWYNGVAGNYVLWQTTNTHNPSPITVSLSATDKTYPGLCIQTASGRVCKPLNSASDYYGGYPAMTITNAPLHLAVSVSSTSIVAVLRGLRVDGFGATRRALSYAYECNELDVYTVWVAAPATPVSLSDLSIGPGNTNIHFWDLFVWPYAATAASLQQGLYSTAIFYQAASPCDISCPATYFDAFHNVNPVVYPPGNSNCAGSCRPVVTPGSTSSSASTYSYTCNGNCYPGWTGPNCQYPTCVSTTYAAVVDPHTCSCQPPFYSVAYGRQPQVGLHLTAAGATCEARCDNGLVYLNPYANAYACIPNVGSSTQGPCQNYGSYIANSDGSYHCSCPVGSIWGGQNCTDVTWVYDACDTALYPNPCAHGGVCEPLGNGTFACDCIGTGYTGPRCDSVIDVCAQVSPCQNGASCFPVGPNQYECACTAGYGKY